MLHGSGLQCTAEVTRQLLLKVAPANVRVDLRLKKLRPVVVKVLAADFERLKDEELLRKS
jgi:hypothetical protein